MAIMAPNSANTFHVDDLQVEIYHSEAEMAQDAAKICQQYLQKLLQQQHQVNCLLATGKSQIKFIHALTALGDIDWSRICLFHLDEYLGIDAEHIASFRYYLRELVEKRVFPQEFHYIQGDTLEPVAECDRYAKLLNLRPIDLCCLGIGDNGHLAFNDPAVANFQDPASVKLVKLDSINRQQQVNTQNFPAIELVPHYAFTVTIPMICATKKIICLAPSARKAKIVERILRGSISPDCPASILRQQPQATLFLDIESASLINNQ